MEKLIEQYVERFHENFPLFALMGMDEAEIEKIIQNALKDGVPYSPLEQDGENTVY